MRRVLIIGTGAMASLFGARISAAGYPVALFGSWTPAIEAIRAKGITLIGPDNRSRSIPISQVTNDPQSLTPFDIVLFLNKTYQLESVLAKLTPWVKEFLHPASVLGTLQNGIGNKEKIQASLRNVSVLAGTTTYAARLITPGTVMQTGDGKVMLPNVSESAEIAEVLKMAGFSISTVADIDTLLWGKVVINSAINPLTAIHRVPNGVLLEDTTLRRKMAETATESAGIASALGIILPYADPVLEVESVCAATAGNLSSMLQDAERGGETEIDAINGEIIAAALRCHIPAPNNLALYKAVKGRVFNNKVG